MASEVNRLTLAKGNGTMGATEKTMNLDAIECDAQDMLKALPRDCEYRDVDLLRCIIDNCRAVRIGRQSVRRAAKAAIKNIEQIVKDTATSAEGYCFAPATLLNKALKNFNEHRDHLVEECQEVGIKVTR